MMRAAVIAAAALALVSCKTSAPPPAATPAPTSAPASGTGRGAEVFIRVSDSFRPESGPVALKAFVADVEMQEKGGECRVTRTGGSGATIVSAFYPARVGQQSQLTMTFDSVGHLIHYSERRGMPPTIAGARGLTPTQLDSAVRTNEARDRSTMISLDYGADRGMAINRGGGQPTTAITGTVRDIERLDQLGPPAARLERARKLCGV